MLTLVKWMYSGVGKERESSMQRMVRQSGGDRSGAKDANKFTQVILDSFWIPAGWTDAH